MFATMTMTTGADDWSTTFDDLERTSIYEDSFDIMPASFSSINFTCGDSGSITSLFNINSMLSYDLNGDSAEEQIIMCLPDIENTVSHAIIFNDDIEIFSNVDIIPQDSNIADTDMRIYSIADVDDDGLVEIIALFAHTRSYGAPVIQYEYDTELVVYEINGTSITYDFSITLRNDSLTNYTLQGIESFDVSDNLDSTSNIDMQCIESSCIISGAQGIFAIDMINKNASWYHDYSDLGVGSYTSTNSIPLPMVITDIDFDDDIEIAIMIRGTDDLIIFDADTGVIEFLEDIGDQVDNAVTFSVHDCTTSQCESGYKELLFDDAGLQCEFYKFTSYSNTTGQLSVIRISDDDMIDDDTDEHTCWIEDRNDDGVDEVCSLSFHHHDNIVYDYDIRCEEISLFGFDSIDQAGELNISNNFAKVPKFAMIDISNDGLLDIVGNSFIFDINNSESVPIFGRDSQFGSSMAVPFTASNNDFILFSRYYQDDLVFISSTGSIDNITINDQIRFRDDGSFVPPYTKTWYDLSEQQFYYNGTAYLPENMSAICSNETSIDWTCDYSSGCLLDTEVDDYKIVMDCFGDGSQIIETGYHFNSQQVDLSCNPQYIDDGEYTMTMWITDAKHDISNNITISVDFIINDSICISYDSDDTLPEILSAPTASSDSPYCGSGTGELVLYNCSENNCFNDTDGDDIYTILVDCDGDGAYESTSSSDDRHMFWCTYDDISVTKTYFKIYTTGDTSQGVTGIIPVVVTESDVICQSDIPRLNGVSTNDTEPFCIGEIVSFFMTENVDYINPIAGSSELYIDCDGDDIYDEYSYDDGFPSIGYHQFDCLIGGNGSSIAMNMINRDGSSNELVYLYSSDTNSCIGQDEELSDQEKLIGELTGASIAWRSFIGLILIIAVMVGVAQMGIQSPFILGGSGIIMGVALTFLGLLPGYIMISLGVLAALTLGGFIFFAKGQTA